MASIERRPFLVNERLIPVIATLFSLVVLGTLSMCVLSGIQRRRLTRIANDPRNIALAREQARLKEEKNRGPPRPTMKTVNVEVDLEIGQGPGLGWGRVMPLSLELSYDPTTTSSSPPPYTDPAATAKLPRPEEEEEREAEEEAKYVRLTVLVALPSASASSRRHHRKEDVLLEATLADAQGRPLQHVESVQPYSDHYMQPLPEMAVGVCHEKWTGELI